jgi:hypothetical protein
MGVVAMAHYAQEQLLAALRKHFIGRCARAIAWASLLSQIIVITAPFANERIIERIKFEAEPRDIFGIEYGLVNEPSQEKYGLLVNLEHAESSVVIEERVGELVSSSAIWWSYHSPRHHLGFCFVRFEGERSLINSRNLDALSKFNNVSGRSPVINEAKSQVSIIGLLRPMMDNPMPRNFDIDEWGFKVSEGSLDDLYGSPQPISLISERKELQAGRDNERDRQSDRPSIGRCLAFLFGCILGSLLIGLWGIVHLDDKERVYGAAAIGLSILVFTGGWLVMLFPDTWGWWL